jgi:2-polyprenyl-3-methyl-5-hydroxy-6-metoxy-1,4-benzoquinol methylase
MDSHHPQQKDKTVPLRVCEASRAIARYRNPLGRGRSDVPDYDTYTKLYGRYLKKGPERFFAKCDPNGKSVLDLCCGGGQLSQYALDHGAKSVRQVDLASHTLNPDFKGFGKTNRMTIDVEGYLESDYNNADNPFDIVVCRQGINYWFKHTTGEAIAKAVKRGGVFVFNTFGNKPSETPQVRSYYHGGVEYKEVSFLFQGRFHHVQTATGMEPHFTVFDWIDHKEYCDKLSPYFVCEEEVDGPSSLWTCWKK